MITKHSAEYQAAQYAARQERKRREKIAAYCMIPLLPVILPALAVFMIGFAMVEVFKCLFLGDI